MSQYRVLHLSDTHLTGRGVDEDGVHSTTALERMLYDARHVPGIDVIVVSGDVADDGSTGGYSAARERIGAFAAARAIPHVYCTGNHDDRRAFAATLGTGHRGPDGSDVGLLADRSMGERAAVSNVGGLRVITLDSLVPGEVHGLIGDAQLRWLREVLSEPAPDGSVLVLHHPPVFVDSAEHMAPAGLQNAEHLAGALRGGDVRVVLCGHFHAQLMGTLAGVPVWVTPGVVTRMDLTTPGDLVRAVEGSGATVVDLGGPFSPTFHLLHARDPRAGTPVYLLDAKSGADVENEA